ncbi:hypothetical protein C8T65DRAFT_583603, partial [Cerioporus squamosus]
QRFLTDQGHSQVEEILQGIKRRLTLLGISDPEIAVADNCCHIRSAIVKAFPDIAVVLDVWHFLMRYLICVVGGMKNPHRSEIARDIVDALLKSTANGNTPAVYRSKEEQEVRLQEIWEKWCARENIWTQAAEKTHEEQMNHVRKGCLARSRDDVRSDGSRIEGAHKGWNGLQRSFASGLELLVALCHDFVLRRNHRIESANPDIVTPFVASTYGSHHIRLVDACAKIFNNMIARTEKAGRTLPSGIHRLPELITVASGERFGILPMSTTTAAHHAMVSVKEEPEDMFDLSSESLLDAAMVLQELGIDPSLLHKPLVSKSDGLLTPRQQSSDGSSTTPSVSTLSMSVLSTSLAASTTQATSTSRVSSLPPSLTVPPPSRSVITTYLADTTAGPSRSTSSQQQSPPRKKPRITVPGMPAVSRGTVIRTQPPAAGPSNARATGTTSIAEARMNAFFAPRRPEPMAATMTSLRPRVPYATISGMTRSQRFLSIASGIDPRALTFGKGNSKEFFLFMTLRAQEQWSSFRMTPFDWLCAASRYNQEIEKLNTRERYSFPIKTPRALMEKLSEVELMILTRLQSGDYKSKSGGTAFWQHHCHAVSLGEKVNQDGEMAGKKKVYHTCSRCKQLMYPYKQGSPLNHRKAFCSDGVPQIAHSVEKVINGQSVTIVDTPPPYPQPEGVFTLGTRFHGLTFLQEVQALYDRVVTEKAPLSMQDLAFASMVHTRTLVIPASGDQRAITLFRLFPSLDADCPQHLLVEYEGQRYLRMNYLDVDQPGEEEKAAVDVDV